MYDRFLKVGSSFNWITPAIAFLRDLLNGPHSDFGIPADSGLGKGDIRRLLTAHGVQVWGLMLNLSGDVLMFTVPKNQARWAYYVLGREGIPILYAPAEIAEPLRRKSTANNQVTNPVARVFDFLDMLHQESR